jgi:citrate lyase subunit beta/citryl-CoA lyase
MPGMLFIDLEDTLAPSAKSTGREIAAAAAIRGDLDTDVVVRVNARSTGYWIDDLRAIVPAQPDAIVIPKIETPLDLINAESDIEFVERMSGIPVGTTSTVILIETAAAVLRADAICQASSRLVGLLFGAEDLLGELGVKATLAGAEVAFSRGAIVAAAKAHGLFSADRAWLSFDDDEGFLADSHAGKSMGFDGRFCQNAFQIEQGNLIYRPSDEEIAQAQLVIDTMNRAQAQGLGQIVENGKFYDIASMKRAFSTLARAGRGAQ